MKLSFVSLMAGLICISVARGAVKVPAIFGDHMVLQQEAGVPVWGTADPGEKVTVTVGKESGEATAGADGKWMVKLAPLADGTAPVTMTVAGKNTLTFKDVLVGEVWVASGQSNMALMFGQASTAATDVPQANDPQLRFFRVGGQPGLQPSDQLTGGWVLTTPGNAPGFSAVAYYFGKELRAKLNRPVGIIQNAIGGTVAEAWTPLDAIKKVPALEKYNDAYDGALATYPQANAEYPAKMAAWRVEQAKWTKEVGVTYDPIVRAWQAADAKALAAGEPRPPKPLPAQPAPKAPVQPFGGYNMPTVLYNGEVAPLIPYAIRGVIWYQGESNAGTWAKYHDLLPAMITGWREHWGQGDFPFLIVQLPNFSNGGNWPQIREAQAQTAAKLPNTAMATVIDVGDPKNLHPVDKMDVGKRLALVARHTAYGEKDLVWTGPTYDSMKVEGNAIRIHFTQIGSGLVIGSSPWVPPHSVAIPTTELLGFQIADEKKNWFPADAKIDGDAVVVSSEKVTNPVAIRYAWQNAPECNLYNKEGLPAGPFRTDDWSPLAVVVAAGAVAPK